MTEKWESEIECILAEAKLPAKNWHEVLQDVFRLMLQVMTLNLGWLVIDSPEGRRHLKNFLIDEGVPPDLADRLIYQAILNSTRPLEGGNDGR
jgi:hypothetical protein